MQLCLISRRRIVIWYTDIFHTDRASVVGIFPNILQWEQLVFFSPLAHIFLDAVWERHMHMPWTQKQEIARHIMKIFCKAHSCEWQMEARKLICSQTHLRLIILMLLNIHQNPELTLEVIIRRKQKQVAGPFSLTFFVICSSMLLLMPPS